MPEYREGQKEAVEKIIDAFNGGKKFVILEAPTGSGKSVIAKTISNIFHYSEDVNLNKVLYMTSQIMLQEQLMSDFGEGGKFECGPPMVHLTGRSNYKCVWPSIANTSPKEKAKWNAKNMNCATGYCKHNDMAMCVECKPMITNQSVSFDDPDGYKEMLVNNKCPYWNKLGSFLSNKSGLINFKSFLYQTTHSSYMSAYRCGLMVVDEAHNQENELLDFVGLTLTDKMLVKTVGSRLPNLGTLQEYIVWIQSQNLVKRLGEQALIMRAQENFGEAQQVEDMSTKLKYLIERDSKDWVMRFSSESRNNTLEIKPIYIRNEATNMLYRRAKHVLMMSATILSVDVMCDSLGVDRKDVEFIEMPNLFPVKNRQIHYVPTGSMSFKNKAKTLPEMINVINEISNVFHPTEKGIIHTHNFSVAEAILDGVDSTVRDRLLFQKHFPSREAMLEYHTKATDPTILIAPALHEGIDLKDDLSRFQIICKMPYPNFVNDPQLSARMKESQRYYNWLTCLKLVQMYGRSIRSGSDRAETYILDSDLDRLLRSANEILPEWFLEAIQK